MPPLAPTSVVSPRAVSTSPAVDTIFESLAGVRLNGQTRPRFETSAEIGLRIRAGPSDCVLRTFRAKRYRLTSESYMPGVVSGELLVIVGVMPLFQMSLAWFVQLVARVELPSIVAMFAAARKPATID